MAIAPDERGIEMFCIKCGNQLQPTNRFCNKCGTEQPAPVQQEAVRLKEICQNCAKPVDILPDGSYLCTNCQHKRHASSLPPRTFSSEEVIRLVQTAEQFRKQEQFYKELTCLYPLLYQMRNDPDYMNALGRSYMHNHNLPAATWCFMISKSINPEQAIVYGHIGYMHVMRGDFAEAERQYKTAYTKINANRDQYESDYIGMICGNVALCVAKQGRKQEATDWLYHAERNGYQSGAIVRKAMGI